MDPILVPVLTATVAMFTSLVGAIVWLIRRVFERDERNTDRFLSTMENLVAKNTATQESMARATAELSVTVRANRDFDREEHRAIIEIVRTLLSTKTT